MLPRIILLSVRPRFTLVMFQNASQSHGVVAPPQSNSPESETNLNDSKAFGYEATIKALNTLQSNAASIQQSIINKRQQTTLEDTVKYLDRSGITLKDLDNLSVIHVSGTKGKGSTCAITESILRAHGVRTGFFSSPHLVSVTERIRIDGQAISKTKFTKAFWKVFYRLRKHQESENDMPAYFKFLTILCFHIFLEEKVDVAILEVGIGGKYDSTNIVRKTSTCGITSLGLEHTNILGDTLEDIAWQKAGIIKRNSKVYTNVEQKACLKVLEDKCFEENVKLLKVPKISEYNWPQYTNVANFNKMVQLNASMAIQLAYSWLKQFKISSLNAAEIQAEDVSLTISDKFVKGIDNCVWPGRCQAMDFHNFRIHLDGAHTLESMDICSDWFQTVTGENRHPKVLIFNATGDRNSKALLRVLYDRTHYDFACFVPNIPFSREAVDDIHSVFSNQDQLRRVESHASNWRELSGSGDVLVENCRQFGTIFEAFSFLKDEFGNAKVDILVTGSLHLLGATILTLEEFGKQFK